MKRHVDSPVGVIAKSSPNNMIQSKEAEDHDDVALVVACVCGAVEKLEEVLRWEQHATLQQPRQPPSLEELYRQKAWHNASEAAMEKTARWSLIRRARVMGSSPQHQKQQMQATIYDWQRLIDSTTRELLRLQLQTQLTRLAQAHADATLRVPAVLQAESIEEDELETRWDAYGRAQPLHRNILGERYSTPEKPLSYRTQRDATEIFRLMRPRMKEELRTRETRRIQRLNQQARAKRSQTKKTLSPEEELEARLDQALLTEEDAALGVEAGSNNSGLSADHFNMTSACPNLVQCG